MQAPYLESILNKLRKFEWAMDLIHPNFRESLLSRSQITHADTLTTFLSAYHYKKVIPPTSELSQLTSGIFVASDNANESNEYWTMALETVANGRPTTLEKIDVAHLRLLNSAVKLIEEICSDTYGALVRNVGIFCIFDSEKFRSASHPHYYGTLFLKKIQSVEKLAVSIVHELAHQELFLLNLTDRLILADFDQKFEMAPLQSKLRPSIARLHSAHALFRMQQFCSKGKIKQEKNYAKLLRETKETFTGEELTHFSRELFDFVYVD
jgi:hypothetical protein